MPDRTHKLMKEMVKWLKFMGTQEARGVIDDVLSYPEAQQEKEEQARIAYELTDGSRPQTEIARSLTYTHHWVSDRHLEWERLGIIDTSGDCNEHLISLHDMGLEYPDIPNPEEDVKEEEPKTTTVNND